MVYLEVDDIVKQTRDLLDRVAFLGNTYRVGDVVIMPKIKRHGFVNQRAENFHLPGRMRSA